MPLSPSPAVVRAADLLQFLAERPTERFTVAELARAISIPRATCHTLLLALDDRDLVTRDADLRYELGPACIVLGDAARVANPALRAAAAQAETLARSLAACAAVTIRDGDETRVAHVFDFGPMFGLRPRVGEAIPLVPPFGATFIAWDEPSDVEAWLDRADPPLSTEEREHYRRALTALRNRGFSITLVTEQASSLMNALEQLAKGAAYDDARRARDQVVRDRANGEYLTTEVGTDSNVRLAQVSAPVIGADGATAAAIMLLGPNHELTGEEVVRLGQEVARAARTASAQATGTERDPARRRRATAAS